MSYFERYGRWHRARILRMMSNPLWLVGMLALVWIAFRWWPAILFTLWLLLCFFLARRKLPRH